MFRFVTVLTNASRQATTIRTVSQRPWSEPSGSPRAATTERRAGHSRANNAWRPVNPYRLLDFSSRYLNIVDGSRLSWQPPECDCRRLRVWVYGGSTTYGLNQRDEHTIASEIARVADEHGVTLDVSNRGEMGHLHWMEAERFAWDLTFEEPPDMVIFYDGVNDGWAASTLNIVGAGDIRPMRDPTTFDLWQDTGRSGGRLPEGPPGSSFIGTRTDVDLPPGTLERVMVERYNRARTLSRTAAEAHRVAVRYVWQPTRYSRPLVLSEPHMDGSSENAARATEQYVRTLLPDDVIDVVDALRGSDKPMFTDDVHHNEAAGARSLRPSTIESATTCSTCPTPTKRPELRDLTGPPIATR